MAYKVKIAKKAQKQIQKITPIYQKKIVSAVKELAENPLPTGVKKMKGSDENRYRIRVGDYRVIYDVIDSEMVILVIKAGHRQQVYKG